MVNICAIAINRIAFVFLKEISRLLPMRSNAPPIISKILCSVVCSGFGVVFFMRLFVAVNKVFPILVIFLPEFAI